VKAVYILWLSVRDTGLSGASLDATEPGAHSSYTFNVSTMLQCPYHSSTTLDGPPKVSSECLGGLVRMAS
jgi:hypothetical protein